MQQKKDKYKSEKSCTLCHTALETVKFLGLDAQQAVLDTQSTTWKCSLMLNVTVYTHWAFTWCVMLVHRWFHSTHALHIVAKYMAAAILSLEDSKLIGVYSSLELIPKEKHEEILWFSFFCLLLHTKMTTEYLVPQIGKSLCFDFVQPRINSEGDLVHG